MSAARAHRLAFQMFSFNGPLRTHRLAQSRFVAFVLINISLILCAHGVSAQTDEIAPGANLLTDGIPKIPASLARVAQRYTTNAYGLPVAGWNASRPEIWIKDLKSDSTVVYRVESPGGATHPVLTIPNGVYDIYYQPQRKYLVYNRDTNGNEQFQLYLYNLETNKSTLLTDGKSRNTEPVWSNAGDRIIFSSSPAGGKGVSLSVLDPLDAQTNRLIAQSSGTYFKAYDWSPDDRQAIFIEYTSNTTSALWLIDMGAASKTLLSLKEQPDEYYDFPQFGKDGKGIYVVTDHDSDFRRLAYIDLATKRFTYLSSGKSDVEDFKIAPDGQTLVYISNEEGISHLHLIDVKSNREKTVPNLPLGSSPTSPGTRILRTLPSTSNRHGLLLTFTLSALEPEKSGDGPRVRPARQTSLRFQSLS
jgi:Tol biopolymer transport system component